MAINLRSWEWTRDRVRSVWIAPYRDGWLMWISGLGIPANIAIHLDPEQVADRDQLRDELRETFYNLTRITVNPYNERLNDEESNYTGSREGEPYIWDTKGASSD